MDRRTFLARLPFFAVGTAAGVACGAEASPRRRSQLALFGTAERAYVQAHEVLHWPARYHEARPLLETSVDAAAEAWLRGRGVDAKLKPHYTWLFVACDRPDEITGIAWRGAHSMLNLMRADCDHAPGFFAKGVREEVRCTLIERCRGTLVLALNNVAHCIEGARREVLYGLPAADGRPLPSLKTPAQRLTEELASLVDKYKGRPGVSGHRLPLV